MVDLDELQSRIEQLVRMAIEAATSLDEWSIALAPRPHSKTPELLELVAEHVALDVEEALASSSAWEAS